MRRRTALFIFGILFSAFLAGAVRVYFSSVQLKIQAIQWLQEYDPNFQIEFDEIHLALSDGLFPRLGLNVPTLSIKSRVPCDSPKSHIKIHQLYLPINLWNWKKLKFGDIQIGHIETHWYPRICSQERLEAEKQGVFAVPRKVLEFFQKRWIKELQGSVRWLSSFSWNQLEAYIYSQEGELIQNFILRDFFGTPDLPTQSLEIKFSLISSNLLPNLPLGPLRVSLDVTPKGLENINLSTHLREGSLLAQGRVDINSGVVVSGKLEVKDIPTQYILNYFYDDQNETIHWPEGNLSWLYCKFDFQSKDLTEVIGYGIDIKNCKIKGDSRVQVSDSSWDSLSQEFLKPVDIKFSNIPILVAYDFLKRPSWLLQPEGGIDGDIQVVQDLKSEFQLKIQPAKFYIKPFQSIFNLEKIKLEGSYHKNILNLTLQDVEWFQGEWSGQLNFLWLRNLNVVKVSSKDLDIFGIRHEWLAANSEIQGTLGENYGHLNLKIQNLTIFPEGSSKECFQGLWRNLNNQNRSAFLKDFKLNFSGGKRNWSLQAKLGGDSNFSGLGTIPIANDLNNKSLGNIYIQSKDLSKINRYSLKMNSSGQWCFQKN